MSVIHEHAQPEMQEALTQLLSTQHPLSLFVKEMHSRFKFSAISKQAAISLAWHRKNAYPSVHMVNPDGVFMCEIWYGPQGEDKGEKTENVYGIYSPSAICRDRVPRNLSRTIAQHVRESKKLSSLFTALKKCDEDIVTCSKLEEHIIRCARDASNCVGQMRDVSCVVAEAEDELSLLNFVLGIDKDLTLQQTGRFKQMHEKLTKAFAKAELDSRKLLQFRKELTVLMPLYKGGFYLTKIEGESDGSKFTFVEPIRYLSNLDEHDDLKVGFLMLKEVMSQGDVDSVTKLRHSDMYYKDLDIATSSNGDKDGMLTPFCIFFPTHTSV
jgi:hypothetical protein